MKYGLNTPNQDTLLDGCVALSLSKLHKPHSVCVNLSVLAKEEAGLKQNNKDYKSLNTPNTMNCLEIMAFLGITGGA